MDFDIFKNLVKPREGARARRICTNCHEQNDESSRHCIKCGHLFQDLKARLARQCPAGHTMDPTWTECPYCEKESQNGQFMASDGRGDRRTRTRAEGQASNPVPSDGPRTPPMESPEGDGRPDDSRIVGVLITYSRHREGEIFPIREGKNFIGKGMIIGGGSPCDIWFPDDRDMSNEHALILYRRGEYLIFDQQSTNGTFINKKIVHFRGEELPNYAELKAGSTTFTFIKAEAQAPALAVEPDVIDEPRRERPR